MRNLVEKQLSWLALIVTAFYSLLGSCRSADTSEECGHERLVKCGIPLERINSDAMHFVSPKDNLRVLCSDLESSMKCIQTYTLDCLEETQRVHFHSLFANTNKLVMELCHDGPYQDEFLKHTPCMRKVQPQYELCNKRYQRTAHEIERSNFTSQSGYLKNICCAFKEYLACSYHTVRRQCGEDTAHFTKEFHNKMSGTLIRVHCEPYTEEVCAIRSGAGVSRMLITVPVALVLLARYFT